MGTGARPAYQRNHEEIIKAMEEGIHYVEGMDPVRAELIDSGRPQYRAVQSVNIIELIKQCHAGDLDGVPGRPSATSTRSW